MCNLRRNPDIKESCSSATNQIEDACKETDKSQKSKSVHIANNLLINLIEDEDLMDRFRLWEAERSKHAMFRSMMIYLHRVETVLQFVSGTRNASLDLHLQAREELNKIFFSMDRI